MPTEAYYERYYTSGYFGLLGRHEATTNNPVANRIYEGLHLKAERIFKFVSPVLEDRQTLVALEVGAANGSNLAALRALDADVTLFEDELDRSWEREFAEKGIAHWREQPDDLLVDFIILSHVLEHFRNPLSELKRILSRLKPDGLIYIEVPNVPENNGHSLPYKFAHTTYLSEQSLNMVAAKAGLHPVKFATTDVLSSLWCKKPSGHG